MLVRTLISALDRAQTPRGVSLAVWGLEKITGINTAGLIRKDVISAFAANASSEWYERNGYYRLASALGGSLSHSGQSISAENAVELTAVYACVKIISEDEGTLPFNLHEQSADGSTVEKAYSHPLYRILHDQPNPEMSAGEFRETLTSHAALGKDGFAKIDWSPDRQRVVYLWPLPCGSVRTIRNGRGSLSYEVQEGANWRPYKREDIFHLRGFTLDGERGDDILRRARHAIGLGLAAQEYAGRFFSQDASAGVILKVPQGINYDPETVTEIKRAWKQWHQGLAQSHEPGIVQDGVEVQRVDPDHEKLQLHESRLFQVVEVARLYRMPLHKLADLTRSTNNNIEHQGIEYGSHTLGPWNRRWKDSVHRCLLRDDERYWPNGRPRMYAEMNVEALQRGDFRTQTDGFRTMLSNGVMSINEVRKMLNMNPVEDGDAHHIQTNMSTLQAIAQQLTDLATE